MGAADHPVPRRVDERKIAVAENRDPDPGATAIRRGTCTDVETTAAGQAYIRALRDGDPGWLLDRDQPHRNPGNGSPTTPSGRGAGVADREDGRGPSRPAVPRLAAVSWAVTGARAGTCGEQSKSNAGCPRTGSRPPRSGQRSTDVRHLIVRARVAVTSTPPSGVQVRHSARFARSLRPTPGMVNRTSLPLTIIRTVPSLSCHSV